MTRPQPTRLHRAFTLIELLICIGIIGLLLGITLPAVERVRHRGYLLACSNNLRSIGQSLAIYASEHSGQFPRTRYVAGDPPVTGTGAAAPNPFGATGPQPNDVTAAFYLLAREQHLPLATFICPYDDVFEYQPDKADPQTHSNFTDTTLNLGYSFADPYPTDAVRRDGFAWSGRLGADYPLAADKNPGTDTHGSNVAALDLATHPGHGSSQNHERDGQNVLYGDGHVTWQMSPLCGTGGDNIYTNGNNRFDQAPVSAADALLLPTDDPR